MDKLRSFDPRLLSMFLDVETRLVTAEVTVNDLKRSQSMENIDLTYLKNIMLSYIAQEELEVCHPSFLFSIGSILRFFLVSDP
jgi:hypothetical protein